MRKNEAPTPIMGGGLNFRRMSRKRKRWEGRRRRRGVFGRERRQSVWGGEQHIF